MKPIFEILTEIADRHLDIPTLRERRRDNLDFHEVSVWGVKDALWYAYQAGLQDRTDEAIKSEGPRNVREPHDDDMRRKTSGSEQDVEESNQVDPARRPYSVLLLYPDYANDCGTETYYAWVDASDPIQAVASAKKDAVAGQDGVEIEPDDFTPLLVTEGHHRSEALFNK